MLDRRTAVMASSADSRTLLVEVPRASLEQALGSTRRYTALTIGTDQASTSLVTGFFDGLVRTHERLPPDTAARAASIGIDLLVASIAERLARAAPKSVRGTLIVQRAAAYIEAQLGDPTLDPHTLAAAI